MSGEDNRKPGAAVTAAGLSDAWRAMALHGRLHRGAAVALLALMQVLSGALPVAAQDNLPIIPPAFPNFAGMGFGFTPDYVGSDEAFYGALPVMRYQPEGQKRHVMLTGTVLEVNVVDDPVIRFGPMFQYRFGRSDVEDSVVARLPEVHGTLEAGLVAALEYSDPGDPRRNLRASVALHRDVLGEHDGFLANASVTLLQPIEPLFELAVSVGLTYADEDYTSTYFGITPQDAAVSGLPTFAAGAGLRDARLVLGAFVPVSDRWFVGAGIMFQQLLGDAADSPIVAERGSAFQLSGGLGVGYHW